MTIEEEPIRLSPIRCLRFEVWGVGCSGWGRVGSISPMVAHSPLMLPLLMTAKNANNPPPVKVDIVSSDKFSAEVRDNLEQNYKQALCHSSVPFTSLISCNSTLPIR